MKHLLILSLLFMFNFPLRGQDGRLTMPAIFSDNMVFQQNSPVKIWGKSGAGSQVAIETSWGGQASAIADNNGKWIAEIKTSSAGGPYELKIKSGPDEIILKNVLLGEVWICSGQSNMEMPLEGWPPNDLIERAKETIENSGNSNIRLFTVARTISAEPKEDCVGKWEESSPETASKFSATAYFFGKKLYEELNIPIGLIHSSWGGTPAEAWTSAKYLEDLPYFKDILNKISGSSQEIIKLNTWLKELPQIDISSREAASKWTNLDFNDKECSKPDYDDSKWPSMNLPITWETTELGNFDGVVWFRKKINISPDMIGKDLVLELGPIDDMDATFVNGKKVGGYESDGFWQTDRVYNIPKELIKDTLVTIAVRVIDNQGGGGIFGKSEQMRARSKNGSDHLPISGTWKYLPVAEFGGMKFYVYGANIEIYKQRPKISFDFSSSMPTTLYNGMISPLIPYAIKGAIWYQGEANVGKAKEYREVFSTMIKNWRADWGMGDFPFYFVQIAPWNYGDDHSELLREAQMQTLSVPNTGMAVTLDVGNPANIHPAKKIEVGNRLAFWALAKTYGKDIPYSGPIYKSYKAEGNKIEISFTHASNGLVIKERNGSNNFVIAGSDKVFKKANVKIDGDKLIVSNPEIESPAAVRYCWDNTSEGTLFNKDGLPASSFRTDTWEANNLSDGISEKN